MQPQYPGSRAQDLLNFFRLAPQQTDDETRMQEINDLLTYNKELEEKEKKNAPGTSLTFIGLGGGLAAIGAMLVARIIPGINLESLAIPGYFLLAAAIIFSLSKLQNEPLSKLREKMEQLHARLVKPLPRQQPKGIFKSRKDKIIAGVAAGLARRFGVQPGLIRLLFLALIPLTGGSAIMMYLILALGMRFLPDDPDA